MAIPPLSLSYDPMTASIPGFPVSQRWLSDLESSFVDPVMYRTSLGRENELVYQVTNVEVVSGDGQLHYGLGMLMPGRVGDEYFLTKGHIHVWQSAAEVYICLSGSGLMLLEDTRTGDCQTVEMTPSQVVYVPGYTAHRTVNIGDVPLIYWGVLSSQAGHDYQYVQEHNFKQVVVLQEGRPVVLCREDYQKVINR